MFLVETWVSADQFSINLCRGHGCLYLETNGRGWGLGYASSPFGLGAYKSGSVNFKHDLLDCRCRHEFSESNASIASTNVPQRSFVGLCVQTTLGWCRILAMPVSIQSYGCCPVVLDQCSMLCHTQCNHSPAWSEQWLSTASEVCLCLLLT